MAGPNFDQAAHRPNTGGAKGSDLDPCSAFPGADTSTPTPSAGPHRDLKHRIRGTAPDPKFDQPDLGLRKRAPKACQWCAMFRCSGSNAGPVGPHVRAMCRLIEHGAGHGGHPHETATSCRGPYGPTPPEEPREVGGRDKLQQRPTCLWTPTARPTPPFAPLRKNTP